MANPPSSLPEHTYAAVSSRGSKAFLWLLPAMALAGAIGWYLRGSAPPPPRVPESAPGASEPAPTPSAAPVAAPEAQPLPCALGLIDNFETTAEGNAEGRLPACEGRLGSWYAFNDGQPGTLQAPYPGKPFSPVLPGLGEPGFALRTRGTCQIGVPSDKLWGAGIAFDLNNRGGQPDQKQGYDAQARGFVGLRFKARLGEDAGATNILRVQFPDTNTDPAGKRCSTCYDDYQTGFRLTRAWKEYRVLWSQLLRGGNGVPNLPFAADSIVAVQFRFSPGDSFDLYLDDVAFIPAAQAQQVVEPPASHEQQ